MDAAVIERYVGLAYEPGRFDCADLVMKVQREVFGREITLPQDRERPVSPIGWARAIGQHRDEVARKRIGLGSWQDGDGVLLARQSGYATHVGVLVKLAGEWYVLHNASTKVASTLTLLRDLALHGWRVEGVYEWI